MYHTVLLKKHTSQISYVPDTDGKIFSLFASVWGNLVAPPALKLKKSPCIILRKQLWYL